MNVRQTRFLTFLFVSMVFLLTVAPAALAEGEKDEKEQGKAKAEKSEKGEKTTAPDSPIYKASQKTAPKKTEEVLVITNEDLDRMWANLPPEERQKGVYQAERHIGVSPDQKPDQESAGEASPGTAVKQPGGDLEWEEQQQAERKQQRSAVSEAEAKVAELQAKVQELERHALAQRNPLLPRRYSDKKPEDEEEAKNWRGMDNEQRVEATDALLQKTRDELAAAQKDLSRLRGSR